MSLRGGGLDEAFEDGGEPVQAALEIGARDGLLGIGLIWVAATRRDADTAFVVTAVATLLTAPFLHPHYLVILLLPAALLFDRLSPAAIAIPLAGWLPGPLLPLAVLAVLALLLLPSVDRRRATYQIPVGITPTG